MAGLPRTRARADLQKPYRLMGDILRRQDRDIVLNLCQYGMGKVWEWGKEVGGHSWRTAGDLGGSFYGIPAALFRDGFDVYSRNELHKYGGPGGWNDPDYLLLGYLSNWKGQTAPTPAHAQRAIHARLALVPGGRAADLQRRHHAPGRLHPEPAHQRRGH